MDKEKVRVLLTEDDPNLGLLLQEYLLSEGFEVTLCNDGNKGLKAFQTKSFDICILDVMMPKKDGFTLATQIRGQNKNVPIVFLTAKSLKEDKISGFEIGADDYITKPFDEEELVMRINAILKRAGSIDTDEQKTVFTIGKYSFDYPNQQLYFEEKEERRMTTKESEVLRLLCMHKNQVLRRDNALIAIYGESDYFYGRSFDVFITKLRKYLKKDTHVMIENIHSVGFRLTDEKKA